MFFWKVRNDIYQSIEIHKNNPIGRLDTDNQIHTSTFTMRTVLINALVLLALGSHSILASETNLSDDLLPDDTAAQDDVAARHLQKRTSEGVSGCLAATDVPSTQKAYTVLLSPTRTNFPFRPQYCKKGSQLCHYLKDTKTCGCEAPVSLMTPLWKCTI